MATGLLYFSLVQVPMFRPSAFLWCFVLAHIIGCTRSDRAISDKSSIPSVEPYTATVALDEVRSIDLEFTQESILLTARAVRVDSKGHFIWAENTPPVYVFDADGRFLQTFGPHGQGPGEFGTTDAMDIGRDGNIHVLDGDNKRVSVFSPEYEFMYSFRLDIFHPKHAVINSNGHTVLLREAWWNGFEPAVVTVDSTSRQLSSSGEIPTWAKVQLNVVPAGGLGVDVSDNVYHTYTSGHQIWKTDPAGALLAVFDAPPAYYMAPDHEELRRIDNPGNSRATQDRIKYLDSISRVTGLFVVADHDLVFQEIMTPKGVDGLPIRFDLEVWHTAGFRIATEFRSRPRIVFADARYLYYVDYKGGEEQNSGITLYEYNLQRNDDAP